MVRVLPDGSDALISHANWSGFEVMLRIYKAYTLRYNAFGALPGATTSFSSYPSSIYSGDDWTQMAPSRLVSLETTIGNDNATLYTLYVQPRSVFAWIRSVVANRLAPDAPTWAALFARYNSGTANDEWLVVDFKRFNASSPAQPVGDNLLWVVDQAPGFVVSIDVSSVLRTSGYFASYNM